MAYMLNVFIPLGVPLAIGLQMGLRAAGRRWLRSALAIGCLALAAGFVIHTLPRITLREWRAADSFVSSLRERFAGQGGGSTAVGLGAPDPHLLPAVCRG